MNKAINFLIDIDHFCEILHWDSVILSYPFFMSIRECRFCWAIFSQIFLQTRTKVEFLAFINGWVQIGQFYFPIQQISLLFARQVLEHRAFCQELIYSLMLSVFTRICLRTCKSRSIGTRICQSRREGIIRPTGNKINYFCR